LRIRGREDLGDQPVENGEQEDQIDDLASPVLELELRQTARAFLMRDLGRGMGGVHSTDLGRVLGVRGGGNDFVGFSGHQVSGIKSGEEARRPIARAPRRLEGGYQAE
jgi:hypothetical protein